MLLAAATMATMHITMIVRPIIRVTKDSSYVYVEHNIPLETPAGCTVLTETKFRCLNTKTITIITKE